MRLRRREDGAVEVRTCEEKSRAESNRNCVAVMRGGEQGNENDQTVTQTCDEAGRGELGFGQCGRASHRATGEACQQGICETTVEKSASMANGWSGQRDWSHPPMLAERMGCALWADELENRTRVDAYNRRTTTPLTGEPDGGNPPVRFGGRGKVKTLVPTPIIIADSTQICGGRFGCGGPTILQTP